MTKHCPNCGAEIKEEYNFCGECGSKIIREKLSKEEKPKEKKIKEEAMKKEEKKTPEGKEDYKKTGKTFLSKQNEVILGILVALIIAAASIAVITYMPSKSPSSGIPSADFTYDKSGPTVYFTSQSTDSDGIISQYYWVFGDGGTSSAQNPTHQYDYAGTYTVTLTVTDDDGNTDSVTKTVTISTTQQTQDSDGDGYNDDIDAFPYDSSEWRDSDEDGYGDNSDAFPYDSTEHLDSDGDGVGDNTDVFPNDPSETKDSDNDGIGDNADIDDDNDGYKDYEDYLPYQNAKIMISILEYEIIDEVDSDIWPSNREGEVYFEIYYGDVKEARFPASGNRPSTVGYLITTPSDWNVIIDVPDNIQMHSINIRMYDDDMGIGELLDIDGHDDSKGLTIQYNVVTKSWTGDDVDGITDGSYDGTQYSDDNDCYLRYNITMV
ncbi:MAG TPA: PKD domain-containing protein [Thermoplasmatales archaeon]|nr:PKD domain-containing protein [Thermoplasmatales archaeon]